MVEIEPTLTVRDGRIVYECADGRILPWIRGGDGPLDVLEDDAQKLRERIRTLTDEEARERTVAEAKLTELRERGIDAASATPEQFEELDQLYAEPDRKRDEINGMRVRLEKTLERIIHAGGRPVDDAGSGDGAGRGPGRNRDGGTGPQRLRAGARFVEHGDYQRLRSSGVLESRAGRVNLDPVEVLTRDECRDMLRQRTTVDVGVAGSLVMPDITPFPPIETPVRRITLLDLITLGDTESNIVEWVKQTVRGDVAAFTPYGTALPEADYEFAIQTATVQRLGQFVPATKGMLNDQGQLQTLLEGQLQYGTRLNLENQVLQGPGTTNNLQGILGTSGINVVTKGDASHATENDLDALHRGITAVRLGAFTEPSAIAIHPTDVETINLMKDNQGRYIYPPGEEIRSIWGFTPVTTPLLPVHTAVVADWRWATLWMRAGLEVSASDGYMDFFTRGLVAIAAELRAAFAVQLASAFAKVVSLT